MLPARPTGLDNSAAQLAAARRLQDCFAPFTGASFDLAISEYGALIFLVNSVLLMLDGISSAPRLDVRAVSGRS